MHSSDNVRDNVSQSYTTTGNIIVVYHHYDGQMTGDNCGIIFPICVLPVVVVVVVEEEEEETWTRKLTDLCSLNKKLQRYLCSTITVHSYNEK